MSVLKSVTPYLYYKDQDTEPIRDSHVYLDLPGEPVDYAHMRTDENGMLCTVVDEKQKGKDSAWVCDLKPEEPYFIFYDDGVLTEDERKGLGTARTDKKCADSRLLGPRKSPTDPKRPEEYYFLLPRKPFVIRLKNV